MADSLIGAISARPPQKLDPNEFKPKTGGDLDVVTEGNVKKLDSKSGNAIRKIAKYKPFQLETLGSNILSYVTDRKAEAKIREAQANIVKETVQSTKEKNPFNNPIERQIGERLNVQA